MPDTTRTNLGYYVLDEDEPEVRGWFKSVNPKQPLKSSLYSFGVERAVGVLAQMIDLPVPDIYLETVDGTDGLVATLVPGKPWELHAEDTLANLTWLDREAWTRYVAFDVFAANLDRHSHNIFVEQHSVAGADAVEARLSLIDYGWCGLWPVYKFGDQLGPRDLLQISQDADIRDEWKHEIRKAMPPRLRNGIAYRGTPERAEALESLRRITDADIAEAVYEIPDLYMTQAARELTAAFLIARLDRIDTLMESVFPT